MVSAPKSSWRQSLRFLLHDYCDGYEVESENGYNDTIKCSFAQTHNFLIDFIGKFAYSIGGIMKGWIWVICGLVICADFERSNAQLVPELDADWVYQTDSVQSNLFYIQARDQSGQLRLEALSKNRHGSVWLGAFCVFTAEGYWKQEGYLNERGFAAGIWKQYAGEGKQLSIRDSVMNGEGSYWRQRFDTLTGTCIIQQSMDAAGNNLDTIWKFHPQEGYLMYKRYFERSSWHQYLAEYWPNGSMKREKYQKGKQVVFQRQWDSSGHKVKYVEHYESAKAPVDLNAQLLKRFPCLAFQGKVNPCVFRLFINKQGQLETLEAEGPCEPACFEEIKAYLMKKSIFKAARFEGRAVSGSIVLKP